MSDNILEETRSSCFCRWKWFLMMVCKWIMHTLPLLFGVFPFFMVRIQQANPRMKEFIRTLNYKRRWNATTEFNLVWDRKTDSTPQRWSFEELSLFSTAHLKIPPFLSPLVVMRPRLQEMLDAAAICQTNPYSWWYSQSPFPACSAFLCVAGAGNIYGSLFLCCLFHWQGVSLKR